jgi:hypothetical protein
VLGAVASSPAPVAAANEATLLSDSTAHSRRTASCRRMTTDEWGARMDSGARSPQQFTPFACNRCSLSSAAQKVASLTRHKKRTPAATGSKGTVSARGTVGRAAADSGRERQPFARQHPTSLLVLSLSLPLPAPPAPTPFSSLALPPPPPAKVALAWPKLVRRGWWQRQRRGRRRG